jgi:hypothetical protein
MAVHIEQISSTVEVKGERPPLTAEQVEWLVHVVLARLDVVKREQAERKSENAIRDSALPPGPGGVW